MELFTGSRPKDKTTSFIEKDVAHKIFNELPVATEENKWLYTLVTIENINSFRTYLKRFSEKFAIATGEERKFSIETQTSTTFKIWRTK